MLLSILPERSEIAIHGTIDDGFARRRTTLRSLQLLRRSLPRGNHALCVECGLCSYVCPSKINLQTQLIGAKVLIEKEKEEIRQEQLRQERLRQEEEAARKQAEEKAE